MAFHLKLLAKFSLTENHLLNYSCYILQKGFEIVISYNHIIDFRQLIKIIRNLSFDILIVRVLQLDISRIIIFIIYSHFKWTSFQIIQILIQTFLFLYQHLPTKTYPIEQILKNAFLSVTNPESLHPHCSSFAESYHGRERPAIVLPLEGRGGCLWSRVRELELGRNVVVMTGKRSRIDDREGRRR